jgi:hypothetical protein
MYVINFWHTVADYPAWKRMFDSDPLGREASGVRAHTLTRPVDDEQTIVGQLEFDTRDQADAFALRLQEIWQGTARDTVSNAGLRISEVLEHKEFGEEAERRAA